jgi:hypothetical protein
VNNYITYSARAKLRTLLEKSGALAIGLRLNGLGGLSIEFLFSGRGDIIICSNPYICADQRTLAKLTDHCIDFSYETDDFIITRTTEDELPSHA